MKFFTASVFVALASLVVTDDVTDISDFFYGLDATDVAPPSCTSATEFFSCYRPVSAYENCDDNLDDCSCSSAMIDSSCHSKYCPNLTFDSYYLTHYCKGTATPISSPANTTPAASASTTITDSSSGKSSSSSSSGSAGAAASASSATPAALATDSSAQATSTTSSTAARSSPNAGEHSVVVSVGGVFLAVAALIVAAGFA